MGSVQHDVEMVAGAAFTLLISWETRAGVPKPLTSYDAEMQVREYPGAPAALISVNSFPLTGSRITLAGAGDIDVFIGKTATTALLAFIGKTLVYDIVLVSKTDAEDRRQLVWGEVEVNPGVSR